LEKGKVELIPPYTRNKNHGLRRDLLPSFPVRSNCLRHGANALGAECLLYLAAALHHDNLLEIWFVGPVGLPVREGHIMSESCGFATMSALSHLYFLSCMVLF
jgi:hypothetical protein